jgi:hypothetical protein
MLNVLIRFFIFSNLLISTVAVLMCWFTVTVFNQHAEINFFLLVFFATLSSYCFHWYFTSENAQKTNRVLWTLKNKKVLLFGFFISSAAVILIASLNPTIIGQLILPAIATGLYSAPKIPIKPFIFLRKIAVAKTFYLALVWTHVTTLLPITFYQHSFNKVNWYYTANRFLYIYFICLLFDYRDRNEDIGILSVISNLKRNQLKWLIVLISLLFSVCVYLLWWQFPTSIIIAIVLPFVLLILSLSKTLQSTADYWYYGVLDTAMCLPTIIIYVIPIFRWI